MQQHVIFGAGLIGGFLYGALASQGHSVAMVARPSVKEKLRGGLKLSDYQGHEASVEPPGFIDSESLATAEAGELACVYLWLTVKCTAVAAAVAELSSLVGKDTVIFCCQNGLGSDAVLKRTFPHNRVLRVMVPFNVAEITAGHLHRGSEGQVSVECVESDISALVEQINCPLIPVHGSEDMLAVLWAKLQLNLANAVNALADVPVKSMLEQRDYRRCISILMKELLAVVNAKNIALPKLTAIPAQRIPRFITIPNFIFRVVANPMLAVDPTVRTSMWWDLSQGKQTEIEYLNGAVVTEAKSLGVACPANEWIVHLIHEVERGERPQGISANALLQLITAER